VIVALVLALLRTAPVPGSAIAGRVRAEDSGAPIAGAEVEVTALAGDSAVGLVVTDSTGRYAIAGLPAGGYHLRVTGFGYAPREVDVYLSEPPRVVVDVALARRPVRLAEVRVLGAAVAAPAGAAGRRASTADVGTVTIGGDALHANAALPAADALGALARLPGVSASPDAPTALHVDGGASADNAVRIDGIPVVNAYHAAGTLTAINPDAIASVTLRAGAPGADLGGAAASVIDLATATTDSAGVRSRGALSPGDVRETVVAALPAPGAGLLLSGRLSSDHLLSDPRDPGRSGAEYGDLLATVSVPLGGGTLEALAFHSADDLAFAAQGERDAAPPPGSVASLPNALRWGTGTAALRWSGGAGVRWDVRAWHTRFGAAANWAATTHLASTLTDLGLAAAAGWRWGGAAMRAGVDADRYGARYAVSPLGAAPVAGTDSLAAPLALAGAPTVVAAFAEARWHAGRRWAFGAGLRDELAATGGRAPEPRLTVRWAPAERVSLALGYARQHQYVQSLRNEESLLDAVAGLSLPVLAGTRVPALGSTLPAERADQLTAALDVRLPRGIALTVGAFARRAAGAVLVAPATAEPFATQTFAIGTARASGLTVALHHAGRRVDADAGYTLESVRRSTGGVAYTPSFSAAQSLTLGLAWHVRGATTLRTALTANSGTPASVFANRVEWHPYTPASGRGDLAGSPGAIVGPLDGTRLPAYVRWDLGVRHTWALAAFGRTARVTGTATVTDVLNRANALGLLLSPRLGAARALVGPGRGLVLGMEWSY